MQMADARVWAFEQCIHTYSHLCEPVANAQHRDRHDAGGRGAPEAQRERHDGDAIQNRAPQELLTLAFPLQSQQESMRN